MRCLFLSDSHYPLSNTIADFLLDTYHYYDAIYILGDLFEFYYGFNGFIYSHHRKLITILNIIGEKRRLVLFEGNHEYKLEVIKEFVKAEVVKSELVENIDGYKVYLAHGDTIDRKDKTYQLFRSLLKSKSTLGFIDKFVPKDFLLYMANIVSEVSKKSLKNKKNRQTEIALEKFARIKLESGFDVVILAHTHKAAFKKFKEGLYINTGEFIEKPSYVVYENDNFCLEFL